MSQSSFRSLALLAALFVVVGSVVPAVALAQVESGQVYGRPDISVHTSTVEFDPGSKGTLELSLTNRGRIDQGGPSRYESMVTTAEALTLEVKSGDTPIQVNTGTVSVGTVPLGSVPAPPIQITIPEDIEPGTYELPVEYEYAYTRIVTYDSNGAEFQDFTRSDTDSVTIRVKDRARFEVIDVAETAQIGDTGDLNVTLQNIGTRAARDASVTVQSRSDELFFGTESGASTAYAGSWAPGENRTLSYTVGLQDGASVRNYTVDLQVGYTDLDGFERVSRTLPVGIEPAPEQEFSLTNVSTSLRVGEEGTLSGTIVNEGPHPVSNPVSTIQTNNPNVHVNSPEYALPDLEPGDRSTVEYTIDVSDAADASVNQFSVTVKYRNQNGDARVSDELETKAEIEPRRHRFVVELAENGDSLEIGGQKSIDIRVTNNGDETLTDVEAKAFVSDPLTSDDDEGLIPELAPGDSAEFTIGLSASGSALAKTYPISVDFQYEMPDGDTETSRTYTIPVEVTESEGGGLPLLQVIGAIALVSFLGVIGWRRRSGK